MVHDSGPPTVVAPASAAGERAEVLVAFPAPGYPAPSDPREDRSI
jgi:hypothetical protein